jgi:hypothetical protein
MLLSADGPGAFSIGGGIVTPTESVHTHVTVRLDQKLIAI